MPSTKMKNLSYSKVTDQLYGKKDKEITHIIEITERFLHVCQFF